MKVEMAFTVVVETETDDYDESIAEARIKLMLSSSRLYSLPDTG